LQTLVLDVKVGNGAFMAAPTTPSAGASLVEVANGAGVKTSALITDMNEPLADAAGNAVEIRNCLAFLRRPERPGRGWRRWCWPLRPRCCRRRACQHPLEDGERQAPRRLISSGKAAEIFATHGTYAGRAGGSAGKASHYLTLVGKFIRPVLAQSGRLAVILRCPGYRHGCDRPWRRTAASRRSRSTMRVGFTDLLPLGTRVERGDADRDRACGHMTPAADAAAAALQAQLQRIGDEAPALPVVISKRI
jgi:thymidine phosphorylase